MVRMCEFPCPPQLPRVASRRASTGPFRTRIRVSTPLPCPGDTSILDEARAGIEANCRYIDMNTIESAPAVSVRSIRHDEMKRRYGTAKSHAKRVTLEKGAFENRIRELQNELCNKPSSDISPCLAIKGTGVDAASPIRQYRPVRWRERSAKGAALDVLACRAVCAHLTRS